MSGGEPQFWLEGDDPFAVLHALEEDERLACEGRCANAWSPGVVLDAESLYRSLDTPTHVLDGQILPVAFDEVRKWGLSVNRAAYCTLEAAWAFAEARVAQTKARRALEGKPDDERSVVAITRFDASTIRAFRAGEADRRLFGVYDTAKWDDTSHADIVAVQSPIHEKVKRSVREALFQAAKGRTVFKEARQS
jgi:hypothetical protein